MLGCKLIDLNKDEGESTQKTMGKIGSNNVDVFYSHVESLNRAQDITYKQVPVHGPQVPTMK